MQTTHKPRKRFGQHFLNSPLVLAQIVQAIAPKPDDTLIEIGPGHGELTQALINNVGTLDAIEIDRDLAAELSTRYTTQQLNLHIQNVLNVDFSALRKDKPIRIVGNLPYNISTPLLLHLFDSIEHIQDMHFMLQLETTQRLTAKPNTKDYSSLSVIAACYVHTEQLFTIAADAFSPPPKVVSAFVRLTPCKPRLHDKIERQKLKNLTQTAFSQRRKQLRKVFAGRLNEDVFTKLGIDPNARVESLSLDDLLNMLKYIH